MTLSSPRRGSNPLRAIRLGSAALGVVAALAAAPAAAVADPGAVGQWSSLEEYPVVPISMGVMPDGKIVAWDQANKPPYYGSAASSGAAMVLDPQTGSITRSANLAPRQTFCSLITSLPDGRLAVVGGGTSAGSGAVPDVQIFDGDSKTFSVAGQMAYKRWYPGGTIDSQGNPVIAGGSSQGVERIDQLTGQSTVLDTTFPADWYPDLLRTPTGSFLIEDVGDQLTAGPRRFVLDGTALTTASDTTQLQTRRRTVRTLIGPHTMFYNSGGSTKDSLVIDASGPSPTYTQVASSRFQHASGQAVTLPTGDVLAIGGSLGGGGRGTAVMTPEIYSTATNTWTSMADAARRRGYHSVGALLPDGRVWSAGSSWEEIQEPNGQFFSPPYLFRKDGSGNSHRGRRQAERPRTSPQVRRSQSRLRIRPRSLTPRSSGSPPRPTR